MKKWVQLALLAVFFMAAAIRIYPLFQYELWGSDTGEYYYITDQLVSDGFVSTDYNGWGFAYPNFPGMYFISGAANLVMRMDVLFALIFVIPIVAALSVLITFFLGKMIFRNDSGALLASAITAIAFPHVFATSHAMPGSMGDVLLLFSLLLLLASIKNQKFLIPLTLTAMALTITHHLSAYFLFIMVLGAVFVTEILRKEERGEAKWYWLFLVFFLSIQILFWTLGAPDFTERVVSSAFDVPLLALFGAGYLALLLAYVVVKIKRKVKWIFVPRFPSVRMQVLKYVALLAVLVPIVILVANTTVFGTEVDLGPEIVILFSPFIVLTSLCALGPDYVKFFKHGPALVGCMIAVLVSAFIGIITNSHVLLPYRHTQYMVPPMALLAGAGLVMLYTTAEVEIKVSKRMIGALLVVILLALTAVMAYPPKEILGGFQEGTSREDMQGVFWARESLPEDATVASDHRMSSMLFGFADLNATWDGADKTLHGSNYTESQDEIAGLNTPSGDKPIDYILLDKDIKEGTALLQWENAEPMSQEAQEKFEKWPFIKLYETGGVEIYGLAAE
jgi:hypothetical protein